MYLVVRNSRNAYHTKRENAPQGGKKLRGIHEVQKKIEQKYKGNPDVFFAVASMLLGEKN